MKELSILPRNVVDFKQFVWFLHDWVHGRTFGLPLYAQDHFQPLASYACVKTERKKKGENFQTFPSGTNLVLDPKIHTGLSAMCFAPDFVAKVENIQKDSEALMSRLPLLASTWNGKVKKSNANPNERMLVKKGTLLENRVKLLMVCKLYWNDFMCGHYLDEVPAACLEENNNKWRLPLYCVDLNNQRRRWPDHENT